jgi:hypothetical protein
MGPGVYFGAFQPSRSGAATRSVPCFLLSELLAGEFGRFGVSEVYSFMIFTPLFIAGWFYVLGLLIDPRTPKRTI